MPGVRPRLRSVADALNRALCPPAAGGVAPRGRLGAAGDRGVSFAVVAGLAAPAPAPAAATPTGYLLAAQHRDGGFGSAPAAASSQLYSGWVALGLAAAGHNPQDVSHGSRSLLAYVRTGVGSLSDVGSLERTILVARAAGASAHSFGGRDLVAALQRDVRRDGSVSGLVNLTAFAVLGLRAAGVAPEHATVSWLTRQQNHDGGFSFATAGGGSDVDDTGAALEALGRHSGRHRARDRFHSPPAECRRGLSQPSGRRVKRAVDGLGGPGTDRRGSRPWNVASSRCGLATAVPALAD